MSQTIFISQGKRIPCPHCNLLGILTENVYHEDLPGSLICSNCKGIYPVQEGTKFPKFDEKSKPGGNWTLASRQGTPTSDKIPKKDDFQEQLREMGKEFENSSMKARADAMAACVLQLFRIRTSVQRDLLRMGDGVKDDFTTTIELAHLYSSLDWNRLQHFLRAPVCALPVSLGKDETEDYYRLIILPQYIQRRVGIPLCSYGGFYVQLMTPYTYHCFPRWNWMMKSTNQRVAPKINVFGDMIRGQDLLYLRDPIPGTYLAEASIPSDRVLMIEDQELARKWLSAHACKPWGRVPKQHGVAHGNVNSMLTDRKDWASPWRRFCEQGRLACFWPSHRVMVEFARRAALSINGVTLVIAGHERTKEFWRLPVADRMAHTKQIRVYETFELDFPKCLETAAVVVIDAWDGFPMEIAKHLWNYRGRLIILAQDPLLDILDDHEVAREVYGLTNAISIRSVDWPSGVKAMEGEPQLGAALAKAARAMGTRKAVKEDEEFPREFLED